MLIYHFLNRITSYNVCYTKLLRDLVALKYACQVNGVTQLMMMKGDVLSGFKTLKVCTAYNYKGTVITHFPYNIESYNFV